MTKANNASECPQGMGLPPPFFLQIKTLKIGQKFSVLWSVLLAIMGGNTLKFS